MRILRSLFLPVILCCAVHTAFSQGNRQLQNLHDFVMTHRIPGYDSNLTYINYYPGGNLNYLYPLYQLFREEKKFRHLLSDSVYYSELSEALSFVGDYSGSLDYQRMAYNTEVSEDTRRQIYKTIQGMKDIEHVDARKYISFDARNYRVIMINEAHNKPRHRAFVLSLLNDLYRKGFHYLAMEMLNNFSNRQTDKLSPLTGHYAAEPVAGELIRAALDMGYKLVPYEDTAATQHSGRERDSIQAENIYRIIQSDSSAKILVLAGFGHIAEKNMSEEYIPMAMAFRKISGIDPLTIDQTDMTEASNFAYGQAFYNAYMEKFSISVPSIALADGQAVNQTSSELYDVGIIYPPTQYRDSRPAWLDLDGRRQPFFIKPPGDSVFLVQAYYQFEALTNKPPQVIPADQTYVPTGKGKYLLYLKRGKYIIVFRDMRYRMLKTQHVEVS